MAGINDILIVIGSYIGVILLIFFIFNFLTNNFIFIYLRVKASRGKKILVQLWELGRVFYCVGILNEGALTYKFSKNSKRIENIDTLCIYRKMNVDVIEVDNIKNVSFNVRDSSAVIGHDAVKTDSMINRALTLPHIEDRTQFIILVVLLILVVGGVVVSIMMSINNAELIKAIPVNTVANI